MVVFPCCEDCEDCVSVLVDESIIMLYKCIAVAPLAPTRIAFRIY